MDSFSLKGKVALVTAGAGPLIGNSISRGLAEAGATLITASRSLEANESFAQLLCRKGFDAHGLKVDITDVGSIKCLHDRVLERFGRLDVLVNSALARVGGSFETQTPEDWAYSAQGDMVGLFSICKAFVPDMVRQGKGSIINVSSIYGVVANDPALYEGTDLLQPPHYNFVKAGMINFTRHIATYYSRKGVRANCISPGGYFDSQPDALVKSYNRRVPIGRMMNHDDIKGAVVFLASDASAYVTGINLLVDGGWTAL
jgi:NAD(P)-dependent dehydrogenase (short-subunit alcohol dehydrogenase family)